jgi:peptide/nickel transport system substrate-binding protein
VRRRRLVWLNGLLVLLLVAAACGGGDDGGDSGGGGGGNREADESGSVEVQGEPDPDGVLRWGMNFENFLAQDQLSPVFSRNACEFAMFDYIYSTLVDFDADNQPVPALAESWEIIDASTIEFTLRENLLFSDGSPLTADNVAQTILAIKEGFPGSNTITAVLPITTAEAVDERTVRITTEGPWAQTMVFVMGGLPGMPLPASMLDGSAQLPVGAGPLRVESFTPGQEMVLVRNEHYQGDWQLGGITFVDVDLGTASATALETGEVDLVSLDGQTSARFTDDQWQVVRTPKTETLTYQNLTLRTDAPPLDDVRVRQAVNHAIKKADVLQAALGGVGTLTAQNFPEGSPWYIDELDDPYPYDPDEARRLLEEAGVAEGTPLRVVYPGAATNVEQLRQAQLVQEQLQDVGFSVTLVPAVDTPAILSEFWNNKESHIFSAAIPGSPDPVTHLNAKFGSSFQANMTGNSSPEVVALLERANESYDDEDARDEAIRDAVRHVVEEALEVPIAWRPRNVVFDTRRLGGTVVSPKDVCDSIGLSSAYVLER